jgi:N-acetylglutamate synthase
VLCPAPDARCAHATTLPGVSIPAASDLAVPELQRLMVDAWPPVERRWVGGWLLRAAGGWTNRANSVLVTGEPDRPLSQALEHALAWYADRGLPLRLALAGPVGFDPPPLLPGGTVQARALTMTAPTAAVARQADPGHPVEVGSVLTDPWWQVYRRSRSVDPGWTPRVLTGSPKQLFARVGDRAVARVGLAHGWAGLAAVYVDPAARGAGLARVLSTALAAAALDRGASWTHLQVESDNPVAQHLYRRLGFTVHHEYCYLRG